jgi:hypothetical protein
MGQARSGPEHPTPNTEEGHQQHKAEQQIHDERPSTATTKIHASRCGDSANANIEKMICDVHLKRLAPLGRVLFPENGIMKQAAANQTFPRTIAAVPLACPSPNPSIKLIYMALALS